MVEPPEITPEMRASARSNPDSWLYVIDPAFDADEEPPSWAVLGAYPVNADGEIEDDFHPNPGYRPSPVNELEELLEQVGRGRRDVAELPVAIGEATLLLYGESADDVLTGFPNHDGRVLVPACTSPQRVPDEWPGWRTMRGIDVVPLLHGHPLVLNPTGPVTAIVPAERFSR